MDTLVSFCKKFCPARVLTIFAAGFILLLNIACSNGNEVGARPNNPSVQMGGQNNPHKAGGDGYNDYQMSTDPKLKTNDRATLPTVNPLLATADSIKETLSRTNQAMHSASNPSGASLKEAKQVPEQPQTVIDRSDPNEKILEKVGTTFKEASKHLTGATEESIERTGSN